MGRMRKSRLSRYKQERLIEHFIAGSTAQTAGNLCAVNRKTVAFFFLRLREIIAYEPEAENETLFEGEIEVDESYFGGRRKGKRGRGGENPCVWLAQTGQGALRRLSSPCCWRRVTPSPSPAKAATARQW